MRECEHGRVCNAYGDGLGCPAECGYYEPRIDRDALLAPAQEMVEAFRLGAFTGEGLDAKWCRELHGKYARRIREACGEGER